MQSHNGIVCKLVFAQDFSVLFANLFPADGQISIYKLSLCVFFTYEPNTACLIAAHQLFRAC